MSIGSVTIEPHVQTTQTWTPSVHVPPAQVFQDRCCQTYRCFIHWNFLPCVSISMPIKLGNHQQQMEAIHAVQEIPPYSNELVTYPPPSAPPAPVELACPPIWSSTSTPPSCNWSSSIYIHPLSTTKPILYRLDHHLCLLLYKPTPLYTITSPHVNGEGGKINTIIMKSTKVLNPRRCIMRTRNTHARTRMEKWPTVRMAVQRRECWISATERFQRKPHKFFDLRCPLST